MTTKAEQVEQISVFLANRPGALADLCTALTEQRINIRALTVVDTMDVGMLRLVVDDPDSAKKALKNSGAAYMVVPVVALAMDNAPGAFADVARTMADHEVNIEYAYASAEPSTQRSLGIFRVNDVDRALRIAYP